jgi:hypothetical protein
MNGAWDTAKKLAEKHASQGGMFVRLQNDGDKVVGVFCGEPYAREVFWDGQKYLDNAPEGTPAKANLRVSLNFYVPSEGAMKVIEGGTAWFKDVMTVRDKYGLDKYSFEVKRSGKPKDPKTKYSILPETPVDPALRAKIAAIGLHDLATLGGDGESEAGGGAAAGPAPAAAPPPKVVDLEMAKALAERIRALPKPVGEAFLVEFRIGRIRELHASDVPAAQAYLTQQEQAAQAGRGAEVDPFEV